MVVQHIGNCYQGSPGKVEGGSPDMVLEEKDILIVAPVDEVVLVFVLIVIVVVVATTTKNLPWILRISDHLLRRN